MVDETQEWARERAMLGKGKVLREDAALVQQCLRHQLRVTWAVAAERARLSWLRARNVKTLQSDSPQVSGLAPSLSHRTGIVFLPEHPG